MDYEFNKGTLAVVPDGKGNSIIYEDFQQYTVEKKPYIVMDESCKYFGSTYNGRKDSAKIILGAEYKVPILVDEINNLVAFPTTSPFSDDCMWISLSRIKKFDKENDFVTRVTFDNDLSLLIPCSYRSIESQISRASRLDLVIRRRRINN